MENWIFECTVIGSDFEGPTVKIKYPCDWLDVEEALHSIGLTPLNAVVDGVECSESLPEQVLQSIDGMALNIFGSCIIDTFAREIENSIGRGNMALYLLDAYGTGDINKNLVLLNDIEKYRIIEGADTPYDLGMRYLDNLLDKYGDDENIQNLFPFVNYEAYGRHVHLTLKGEYSFYGYVYKDDSEN